MERLFLFHLQQFFFSIFGQVYINEAVGKLSNFMSNST